VSTPEKSQRSRLIATLAPRLTARPCGVARRLERRGFQQADPRRPTRPLQPTNRGPRVKNASRPVSRVLYGAGCPARDGHSSGTIVADRLEQPTRATRAGNAPATVARRHRPYSVLLPVGFAVPRPLPAARCALTAPFHPYRRAIREGSSRRRFAFCGTFPGVTPAGRYPAPCFRGARTFLHPFRQRPSGRLAGVS